jgi:hypothetical protein
MQQCFQSPGSARCLDLQTLAPSHRENIDSGKRGERVGGTVHYILKVDKLADPFSAESNSNIKLRVLPFC